MITRKIWSLLALVLLAAMAQGVLSAAEEKEGKGQDEKVALEQVPVEIKAAAVKAVEGLKLVEAEKEVKNGVAVWELKGTVGEKTYEVKVDAAGKVLKAKEEKKGDKEDGDKEDDDDDDK